MRTLIAHASPFLLMFVACQSPQVSEPVPPAPEVSAPTSAEKPPLRDTNTQPPTSSLPRWETQSRLEFEALLTKLPTLGDFDDAFYANLSRAAMDDTQAEVALRAALLLARRNTERADRMLLMQLEARNAHPERPADAADVVAAARLAASPWSDVLGAPARLAALADGATPHPDLEVRVECARSALLAGRDDVAAFLLRLTRLDTPLGLARDGAWHSTQFTTWARNRAAEALCERMGIACPYRADAAIAERETAAQAIESAWTAVR